MANRTCLWCANPCEYYFKTIAPECARLLGQEEQELRQYIASNCPDYKQAEQRFFTYSNGEPYYG